MKGIVFILIMTVFSTEGFTQIENLYKKKSVAPVEKKPLVRNFNHPKVVTIGPPAIKYNTPVLKLESKGVLKGNNGRGSDIYVYAPDNMPVLKPDSTFRSKMPGSNSKYKTID